MDQPGRGRRFLESTCRGIFCRAEHSMEENPVSRRPRGHGTTSCGFFIPCSYLCKFFSKYPVEYIICFLPGISLTQLCDGHRWEIVTWAARSSKEGRTEARESLRQAVNWGNDGKMDISSSNSVARWLKDYIPPPIKTWLQCKCLRVHSPSGRSCGCKNFPWESILEHNSKEGGKWAREGKAAIKGYHFLCLYLTLEAGGEHMLPNFPTGEMRAQE